LQTSELFKSVDVVVNLCGGTVLRDYCLSVPVRIYLETDPVRPQIEVSQGRQFTIELLAAHTHHFTYGENLLKGDCGIPMSRFQYTATRPPVITDWWSLNGRASQLPPSDSCFTTVANWQQSGKDIEWQGQNYSWSKHLEFLKFVDLPSRSKDCLQMALSCDAETRTLLISKGWSVIDSVALTKDILPYRDYIIRSRGEFTVAKSQYVLPGSGWFSDRSVCYLGAGRPVVTQETGFSKFLPTGLGLFAFETFEDVLSAFDNISGRYKDHCQAAREIACEYFSAEKVLKDMCNQIGF
jgi:hypothetical protein